MKIKFWLAVLVASLAANASFAATTAYGRWRQAKLPMERLGLDSAQRAKLEPFRTEFLAERSRPHARMAGLQRALGEELGKPEPDSGKMLSIAREMGSIQGEMRPKLIAYLGELHSLLRPDQRQTLADILRSGASPGAPMIPGCPGAILEPPPSATGR